MKRQFLGSTLAIIFGVLLFFGGVSRVGKGEEVDGIIYGPLVLIGVSAYRSAKKRKLGLYPSSETRIAFELLRIIIVATLWLSQKDLKYLIATDPFRNFMIPMWVLIAYGICFYKAPKSTKQETIP